VSTDCGGHLDSVAAVRAYQVKLPGSFADISGGVGSRFPLVPYWERRLESPAIASHPLPATAAALSKRLPEIASDARIPGLVLDCAASDED